MSWFTSWSWLITFVMFISALANASETCGKSFWCVCTRMAVRPGATGTNLNTKQSGNAFFPSGDVSSTKKDSFMTVDGGTNVTRPPPLPLPPTYSATKPPGACPRVSVLYLSDNALAGPLVETSAALSHLAHLPSAALAVQAVQSQAVTMWARAGKAAAKGEAGRAQAALEAAEARGEARTPRSTTGRPGPGAQAAPRKGADSWR